MSEVIGAYEAILRVDGAGAIGLAWRKPNGREQNSAPADLLNDFEEEIKAVKDTAKDIISML